MIDDYYIRQRKEIADDEKAHQLKLDIKLSDLRDELSRVLKIRLSSFTDIDEINTEIIVGKLSEITQVLNNYSDESGATYALNCILYHHDLSYETLKTLFLELPPSTNDSAMSRQGVANKLIKKLAKGQDDFFDLFNSPLVPLLDQPILICGLVNIANETNRPRIINILSKNIEHYENIDFCTFTARKLKLTELKHDFERVMPLVEDPEIRRNVQRLLSSKRWE